MRKDGYTDRQTDRHEEAKSLSPRCKRAGRMMGKFLQTFRRTLVLSCSYRSAQVHFFEIVHTVHFVVTRFYFPTSSCQINV